MSTDADLRVLELRDSVAWAAGQAYERRRIGELLRQRAALLREMPGPTSRSVQYELKRFAALIDEAV